MLYQTIHQHHCGWDNSISPVVHISAGETLEFQVQEASGGKITRQSTAADLSKLTAETANPTTGPIYIEDAEPGDVLQVEVQGFQPSGWGWTALIPGFGLLAEDFPDAFLHHSYYDTQQIEFLADVRLPLRPFTGTIGVAPATPGWCNAIPPHAGGGNLDIRHLTEGATLLLPVQVKGALFSVGDTHAAQGDGEVCGTAIESPMKVQLRFSLQKHRNVESKGFNPQLILPPQPQEPLGWQVTTGIAPDLMQAAQNAIRAMIDFLQHEYKLDAELAYCLCSVAVDLRIAELVNAPNWVVTAHLPRSIFR